MSAESSEWKSACPHPEAVGTRWGDPISEARKAELKALADKQREWAAQPEAQRGVSHFKIVELSGADVFWLATYALAGPDGDTAAAAAQMRDAENRYVPSLSALHLEGAYIAGAHMERAYLARAHLDGACLSATYLECADFNAAHLKGANLNAAHMEEVFLNAAHMEGAELSATYLERANLNYAHLERAFLWVAYLEGAYLREAHLEGANLRQAHLEGKEFASDDPEEWQRIRQVAPKFPAFLPPADLRAAFFDAASVLNDAVLVDEQHGAVQVADVRWGGVNLAVVPDWSPFIERRIPLGDERAAWGWKPEPYRESEEERRQPARQRSQVRAAYAAEQAKAQLGVFQTAVRANRQLATALRAQGMNEQSDYFAYRAQVVQRAVLRQEGKRGRAFGSWLLDHVAGYGYQPLRSAWTYVAVILSFAVAYFAITNFGIMPFLPTHSTPLAWYEALVLSISSFHGRGMFPTGLSLGDPIAILAAGEAIIGLLIEITFIATFTQRFFAR